MTEKVKAQVAVMMSLWVEWDDSHWAIEDLKGELEVASLELLDCCAGRHAGACRPVTQ